MQQTVIDRIEEIAEDVVSVALRGAGGRWRRGGRERISTSPCRTG